MHWDRASRLLRNPKVLGSIPSAGSTTQTQIGLSRVMKKDLLQRPDCTEPLAQDGDRAADSALLRRKAQNRESAWNRR